MGRIAQVLNATGWVGAVSNVVMVWGLLAASIFLLSRFGSSFGEAVPDGPRSAPWTPPGALIAGVWSCLYTLMGLSLWSLNRVPEAARVSLKGAVFVLIAFCLVWPFYAFGTISRWPGLLGNLGILAIAWYLVSILWSPSRSTAFSPMRYGIIRQALASFCTR